MNSEYLLIVNHAVNTNHSSTINIHNTKK